MTNNARQLAVGMAEHLIENDGKCPTWIPRAFLREMNNGKLFKTNPWQRFVAWLKH